MRQLIAILLLAAGACAYAQTTAATAAAAGPQQFWLVELSSAPTADGGTAAAVQKDKTNFRSAAAAAKIIYTERKSFDTLWNGLAIQATPSAAAAMLNLQGVKAVYPDLQMTYEPRTDGTSTVEMATAITMTGADLAQNNLGLTGNGVKVAVIDTGIDYGHPDLGGCFGAGCRVVKGWDFVGDAFDAGQANPIITPDPDPMDCAGHGTHVSGIIGANGDPSAGHVRGVAPGVTFYAYRVFGCSGSTLSSVMIDAMEHALNDGAQVVNMSIGSAYTWPQYPTATASDRLVKKGVVVVASFGNSGPGLYSGGAPGVGQDVIGVASFDNIATAENSFTVSPDDKQIGYLPATGAPVAPQSGTFTLARTGTTSSTADACSALPAGSLAGKVALIRRGTCSFYIKATNAENAGAAGVILYNNTTGTLNPTVAGTPAITIPVVAITSTDGATINGRIAAGATTMTWTALVFELPNPSTGGLISSFSSVGLSPDLAFKPDIGAPGGNIRSTWPRALGSYAVLSGTSMASPHVAGSVALLLEANPKLQARKVRDVLQNNAIPHLYSNAAGTTLFDGIWHQGAGMLNIYDAVLATTRITPGKLALGESAAGPQTRSFTITNNSNQDVTYDLSSVDGLSVSNTFAPVLALGGSTVAFSSSSVTVPAGSDVTVNATITAPAAPAKGLYGGWILVTPQGGGQEARLPFGGFIGDYQSIVALAPTTNGFPWLTQQLAPGGTFSKRGDGTVYTMADAFNIPYILFHLDHEVAALQMQVLDANTGRNWQFFVNDKYDGRNSTATGAFASGFDGTTFNPSGKNSFSVPNGQYIIVVRALKALGDPDNPADWETWTSPVFVIARP